MEDIIRMGGERLAWSWNNDNLERVYYSKKQYEQILYYLFFYNLRQGCFKLLCMKEKSMDQKLNKQKFKI